MEELSLKKIFKESKKIAKEILQNENKIKREKSAGWQLCPKCYGDGHLSRYNSPPLIGTTCALTCDVCNGKKIISINTGLPPV